MNEGVLAAQFAAKLAKFGSIHTAKWLLVNEVPSSLISPKDEIHSEAIDCSPTFEFMGLYLSNSDAITFLAKHLIQTYFYVCSSYLNMRGDSVVSDFNKDFVMCPQICPDSSITQEAPGFDMDSEEELMEDPLHTQA